jgi:hypothetical protein
MKKGFTIIELIITTFLFSTLMIVISKLNNIENTQENKIERKKIFSILPLTIKEEIIKRNKISSLINLEKKIKYKENIIYEKIEGFYFKKLLSNNESIKENQISFFNLKEKENYAKNLFISINEKNINIDKIYKYKSLTLIDFGPELTKQIDLFLKIYDNNPSMSIEAKEIKYFLLNNILKIKNNIIYDKKIKIDENLFVNSPPSNFTIKHKKIYAKIVKLWTKEKMNIQIKEIDINNELSNIIEKILKDINDVEKKLIDYSINQLLSKETTIDGITPLEINPFIRCSINYCRNQNIFDNKEIMYDYINFNNENDRNTYIKDITLSFNQDNIDYEITNSIEINKNYIDTEIKTIKSTEPDSDNIFIDQGLKYILLSIQEKNYFNYKYYYSNNKEIRITKGSDEISINNNIPQYDVDNNNVNTEPPYNIVIFTILPFYENGILKRKVFTDGY